MINSLQPTLDSKQDKSYISQQYPSSYSDDYPLHFNIPDDNTLTAKQDFVHADHDSALAPSVPSTAPSSPSYFNHMSDRGSFFSTPTCSNLDPTDDYSYEEHDEVGFPIFDNRTSQSSTPTYDDAKRSSSDFGEDVTRTTLRRTRTVTGLEARDDSHIEYEPSQHVDYLSHEWDEPDIWSSWRYIVGRRNKISNCERLENAAWRTWVKAKYRLCTVNPESLNWMKDCDVTWLYGPLHIHPRKDFYKVSTPPASQQLSTSSSFLNKKPILKKRSPSAILLEKSLNEHTLLQRAGEIIQYQRNSPIPQRTRLQRHDSNFSLPSYYVSSVLNTPDESEFSSDVNTRCSFGSATPFEAKHVFFNEEVRQVQAIDSEEDEKDHEVEEDFLLSDEDDDGGLMMAPTRSRSNKSTPRSSFSESNKTIAPLPPTTLKSRSETPRPQPPEQADSSGGRGLYHSPSQETLKPTNQHNFLIDDDPEVDEPWLPQATLSEKTIQNAEVQNEPHGMRRTASGMFMPADENEDEAAMNNTLFGQAVYAVNTFRDIAHVIWNVGWTRNR